MTNIIPVSDQASQSGAEYICKKFDKLDANKSVWRGHWRKVAKYTMPNKDFVFGGQTEGEEKDFQLYDAIGVYATDRLASMFHGMLTNPASVWFALSSGDPQIDSVQPVAKWLQDTARKMVATMNSSNFQTEVQEVYQDLCSLGTAHIRVEEDEADVLRFTTRPIYDCAISENHLGVIDCVYYKYEMTLDQLCEAYPDTVTADMKELRFNDPLKKYIVIHAVEPTDRLPPKLRHPVMKFTSIHVLKDGNIILKKSGFEENPCIVPRFSKISGEMYGRSPAMKALPDIMMADVMMQAFIDQAQVAITPPVQVPDEGVLLPLDFSPRGQNYYRAGTKDRIEPIQLGGNLSMGDSLLEKVHEKVKQAFFLDQLHLVENDRMTATEVMQRKDEQLRTMSPILGRLQHEFLRPVIERVFGIMARKGLFDALPLELKKAKLEVKFVSQIARAQESVDGDNFQRAYSVVTAIMNAQPQAVDLLDGDKIVQFAMKTYGAPLSLLRTDEELKKMREARNQQQQQQQQIQNAQQQSEVAKNVAQTAGA